MSGTRAQRESAAAWAEDWVGWCCAHCASPLAPHGHGLYCAVEARWFATDRGVHRLLPEERRRELLPMLELYQRVRRDEGWRAERDLPDVGPTHPFAAVWKRRAASFRRALKLATDVLGRGPWRVLDAGAGNCWASAQLLRLGHRVVAADINLDPTDGLLAAPALLDENALLPRVEAELASLPIEARTFDLVWVAGALHYAQRLAPVLIELRRVTRKGGVLLVVDSPAYRRSQDGEAMVSERSRRLGERYRLELDRETQSGYLVLGEIAGAFRGAGWGVAIHGWPGRLREAARDALEIARWGRRTARFPILLARRDG